jgi:hypothetical protein
VGGVSATTNAPADAGMTEELLRYLQQGRGTHRTNRDEEAQP